MKAELDIYHLAKHPGSLSDRIPHKYPLMISLVQVTVQSSSSISIQGPIAIQRNLYVTKSPIRVKL